MSPSDIALFIGAAASIAGTIGLAVGYSIGHRHGADEARIAIGSAVLEARALQAKARDFERKHGASS